MTRRRKTLLWVGGAMGTALLVAAGVWGVPFVRQAIAVQRHGRASAATEPAVLAEWTERFGDPAKIEERFPPSPENAVAFEVGQRAKQLGISLDPTPREEGDPLDTPEDRLHKSISAYVRGQIGKTSGEIDPPDQVICEYLERQSAAISEMSELLARSDSPRWGFLNPGPLEGPSLSLLGHLRLTRVLLADSFARSLAGEYAAAELRLLAAWNLNASLRDRPDVVSLTIAVANARMLAGAARWIPVEDPDWTMRLAKHDYRSSLRKAIVARAAAVGGDLSGESLWERAARADYYRIHLNFLERLERSSIADSARGPVVVEETPEGELTEGGIIAGLALPNNAHSWRKADRLKLETELTLKILEAKRARRRDGGWPPHLDGVESSILGEPHWVYAVEDGRMRIDLSAPLEWRQDWSRWAVPLEFESR